MSTGRIAVLGAGAWGTALARLLAEAGETVQLWTWQSEHAAAIQRERTNAAFFPGFQLPDRLRATADLATALAGVDVVVVVVPSHALRPTIRRARAHLPEAASLVVATKGIEDKTLMLMTEVIEDELGAQARSRCSVLSGPSFAKEVARGMPTNVVVAGADQQLVTEVQQRFATERFRIYSSDDPVGVQIGGAVKNPIAIAAGACDGLSFGHNTRAALITRGLAEMTRLSVAKGGQRLTLAGLAGMGDLVLTCTGELSRNRTVGFQMGQGHSLEQVLDELGHVAEGVTTAKSAYALAQRLGVELPICEQVYQVLFESKAPRQAVHDVLQRPLRKEQD